MLNCGAKRWIFWLCNLMKIWEVNARFPWNLMGASNGKHLAPLIRRWKYPSLLPVGPRKNYQRATPLPPTRKIYDIESLRTSLCTSSPSKIVVVLVHLWFHFVNCLFLWFFANRSLATTWPRGTPCREGRHGSVHEVEHPRMVKAINTGYDNTVSHPVPALIEDWEST